MTYSIIPTEKKYIGLEMLKIPTAIKYFYSYTGYRIVSVGDTI